MTNEKLEELAKQTIKAIQELWGCEDKATANLYATAGELAHAVLQYLGKEEE